MVRRIFVEKKKGCDASAQEMLHDIAENLGIKQLSGIRLLNRYDMEGVGDTLYEQARYTVFAEPAIDTAYDEEMPEDLTSASFFAVEYLPGQYDQRADSAAQCLKLLDSSTEAIVKYAKVIVPIGDLTQEQMERIKGYCINPVDSQIADNKKPNNLEIISAVPEDVQIISGFRQKTPEEREEFRKESGFAMSGADLEIIQQYFEVQEQRDPTITELRVLDTYWSDHCRHTTFNTAFTDIHFEDTAYAGIVKKAFDEYLDMRKFVYGEQKRDITLMDMASIGTKYLKKKGLADDLDESEEINACSIKVKAKVNGGEEDWLVMFKNETHNHPTEIEPFGGAATCLGGAIRDPLSGRVYVYQAMRVTGCADPRKAIQETLPGKLPQRKITKGAAAGYSSYGNQIGLATGLVDEIYDEGYVAKRMEVGAVVGAAPADHVLRERPIAGDVIILVGGRTGRDGCGGATGSSKEHTEDSILDCGAEVQKGNPPVERNIQRLFRRKEVATLIKRCNDFGAGGVSVAIGELAEGLDINLDLVPKKYEGLDGTELAISESQERMAVVVAKEKEEAFIAYAAEENLEATAVAWVTDQGRVRMQWRNKCILDLSREFLDTNGAKQEIAAEIATSPFGKAQELTMAESLADLNCAGKKGLIERFDSTIGAGTVLMPLGGKYQLSPAQGMAAKLPVTEGETTTATMMTYGFDPEIAKMSPFHGALYAVIDSVTKIVAMGGDYKKIRLTFQEFFEKLGSDKKRWGKPLSALLGALKVQRELGIPAIGGKDSMSGTFMDLNVPPTLISFAVNSIDAGEIISTEFKEKGSKLVYLPVTLDEDGIIDFEKYRAAMDCIRRLAETGKILAASAVGRGGIFVSLIKMAAGNKIGFKTSELLTTTTRYGSVIMEIPAGQAIGNLLKGIDYKIIGETTGDGKITAPNADMDLEEIICEWQEPLEDVFPVKTREDQQPAPPKISWQDRNTSRPAANNAQPRIIIPTFPGTNCEMDSKRAFERAGGKADIHIIRNLTEDQLIESTQELENKIRQSQIIMLPGGFSGGDEPDGSAKFITAIFRNPRIKEAVMDLLENRDGLMLGICNGFQALIKLGLVPEGRIMDNDESRPTLTYNKIGRHVSSLVRTRIASVKSPWLSGVDAGDIHTLPVSHGEGRFIASRQVLDALTEHGQIATQYVDFDGNPSMDIAYNPNGSDLAIEGVTSPDGRVFGKMGHSERIGQYVYKNVLGQMDQKIFESGVKYFK